jgi:hypothetical protein
MIKIDHAIKETIAQIKLEEARLEDLEVKIAEVRPEVSVAT